MSLSSFFIFLVGWWSEPENNRSGKLILDDEQQQQQQRPKKKITENFRKLFSHFLFSFVDQSIHKRFYIRVIFLNEK